MPVHNGAAYIREAIQSVLDQTLQNWELIVIDDGSTDASVEITRSFEDQRIHIKSRSQAGRSTARNVGLDAALGRYVVFLDADDKLLPEALESNLCCLELSPTCGLVYSDGFFCDNDGHVLETLSKRRRYNATGHVLGILLVDPLLNASNCAMIRRDMLDGHHIRFDPSLDYGEDWDFFKHVAEITEFAYNATFTCQYRIHGGNSTLTQDGRRRQDIARIRLRNLASEDFRKVSPSGRFTLFYQLLFDSFVNDREQQQKLLTSTQFQELEAVDQANLLRFVATSWILDRAADPQARELLVRSLSMEPGNRKTRLILSLDTLTPSLVRSFLRLRKSIQDRKQLARPVSPFFQQKKATRIGNKLDDD